MCRSQQHLETLGLDEEFGKTLSTGGPPVKLCSVSGDSYRGPVRAEEEPLRRLESQGVGSWSFSHPPLQLMIRLPHGGSSAHPPWHRQLPGCCPPPCAPHEPLLKEPPSC